MAARADSATNREVLALARQYRRKGYSVVAGRDRKPPFLGDFSPDLIAERDDDKVVVEVKRADAVAGANDIVALARMIADHPPWRFELVTLPAVRSLERPDASTVDAVTRPLLAQGMTSAAYVMVYALIENAVAYAAVELDIDPTDHGQASLIRQLVVSGVIDEEARRTIERAGTRRNALVHQPSPGAASRDEVDELAVCARSLIEEVVALAAPQASYP